MALTAEELARRQAEKALATITPAHQRPGYGGPPKLDARAAGREAAASGVPLVMITVPGGLPHSQLANSKTIRPGQMMPVEERIFAVGSYVIAADWAPPGPVCEAKGITIKPVQWAAEAYCPHCGAQQGQPHDLGQYFHPGVWEEPAPEPPKPPPPESEEQRRRVEEYRRISELRARRGFIIS